MIIIIMFVIIIIIIILLLVIIITMHLCINIFKGRLVDTLYGTDSDKWSIPNESHV